MRHNIVIIKKHSKIFKHMESKPSPIKNYDFDVDELWAYLRAAFEERIVIIDGAMGTQLQTYKL